MARSTTMLRGRTEGRVGRGEARSKGSHNVLYGQAHIIQNSLRRKGPCGACAFHEALESD